MITIGLTYYDNRLMFERVRDYYVSLANEEVKFLVVDDASPVSPLTPDDMPERWSLLQVTEDVGWNNEGAKNLIMQEADTEWVINCDLDHVLLPHVYRHSQNITRLEWDQAPFLRKIMNVESGGKVTANTDPIRVMAANSYAITKEYFWALGGYDETFQGLYGYDGSLVKKLGKHNHERLHAGLDCFTYGGGGSSWTREEKDASHRIYHEKGKAMARQPDPRRIKFPWRRLV